MRYEIGIGEADRRDITILHAPLVDTPKLGISTAYRGEGDEIRITPNYIDATFTRTPQEPVWRCTIVEVGGPKVHGKTSRSHLYKDGRGMPYWLQLVLDELMKGLPE